MTKTWRLGPVFARKINCTLLLPYSRVYTRLWFSNFAKDDFVRYRSPLLIASCCCFAITFLLSGCFRDPNVRKQKFVEQGDAYFKNGKYPEAQISYARALQIDARFVPALYKSAQ